MRDKKGRFVRGHTGLTRIWSIEEETLLKKVYPVKTPWELQLIFKSKTSNQIYFKACALKLKKTKELIKKINRILGKRGGGGWLKGKQMPDDFKEKISRGLKKYYKTHDGPWKGKARSEETKKKISLKLKDTRKGKLNPIWRPGVLAKVSKTWFIKGEAPWNKGLGTPNDYGHDFTKELKEQIRVRDSFTCQKCELKEVKELPNFSIHHIDFNKMNNSSENLSLLCQSCHNRITVTETHRKWRKNKD